MARAYFEGTYYDFRLFPSQLLNYFSNDLAILRYPPLDSMKSPFSGTVWVLLFNRYHWQTILQQQVEADLSARMPHDEDTPCASWVLGCHISAFSPFCVRVPTGNFMFRKSIALLLCAYLV